MGSGRRGTAPRPAAPARAWKASPRLLRPGRAAPGRSIGRGGFWRDKFSWAIKYHEPGGPGHGHQRPENVNLKMALAAQALQDRHCGEAIRHKAAARLEIAHRRAGLLPEPPARLAHVESIAREMLLQLEPLGAGEHALLARPGLHDRPAAAQPVGEMPDGKRIGFGRVVLHQRLEI